MSPKKVMPLLLTVIMTFIMMAGVARADSPIILAQAAPPQHKEEEEKQQHGQQKQQPGQQQQHGQQQPPHGQQQQQQQHGQQQQQHGQQQQDHAQQQKALEEHKAQELKAREAGEAQKHAQQQKLLEDQHKIQELKAKEAAEAQKRAQDEAKLHNDQKKIQQLQHEQRSNEQQLHTQQQKGTFQQQQAHQQENKLHHELSAEEQKAKAERDAHRLERERLIEHQRQMAATERSQAAINERLRLQNERLHAITSQRQQTVDQHGQTVIKEPGNRTIVQANGHAFIQHDETANFRLFGGTPQTRRAPNGNSVSSIVRPDGSRIEIEVDTYGRPLRRVRFLPDGRRFVLFENRALAVGAGFALGAFIVSLPHVEVDFPREQYIVDADVASEDDISAALYAGPVVALDRGYSLDEVLASIDLRERMRSISIDSINFEFGSWELGPNQAQMLESVAAVIRDMANQNPGEVFLIEGHTDAVGSEVDNLSLSDRRAQAVAEVLSQQFGIPAENLVTQGYGKQFLLIPTPEPERRNRRVVVRRITPILQTDSARFSASDGGPGDGDRESR